MLGAKAQKPMPVDPSTLVKPVSSQTTFFVIVAAVALVGFAAWFYIEETRK